MGRDRTSHSFPSQLPFINPYFCERADSGQDDTPDHPILLSSLQLFTPAWHSLLSCGESIPVAEHQTDVKITEFFAAAAA